MTNMQDIHEVLNDIFSLIKLIQKRPGMYLNKCDIHSFESFMNGLFMGYFLLDKEVQNREGKKLEIFKEFICQHLSEYQKIGDKDFPQRQFLSYELLLKATGDDAVKALDLYFELLDTYENKY